MDTFLEFTFGYYAQQLNRGKYVCVCVFVCGWVFKTNKLFPLGRCNHRQTIVLSSNQPNNNLLLFFCPFKTIVYMYVMYV